MTLIEGVGDEVTDFFIVVGVLLVGWIAWCSTNISDQPLIRTVLILQHRTRTRIAELRANNQPLRTDNRISNFEESSEETITPNTPSQTEQTCPTEDQASQETSPEITPISETSTNPPAPEEVLIQAMDSLNENTNLMHATTKLSSNESTSSDSITETIADLGNELKIKLKFINDDQKIVTGRSKEMLGDFKRRHFQVELDAQKRVRLVFNGQVLHSDDETLEKCGLFNDCVVHCLVHQRISSSNSQSNSTVANSSSIDFGQTFHSAPTGDVMSSVHNDWDLTRLLFSILSLILAFAWYFRYNYAQLFTATTTLALYALTAIFTLSVVGHFFPDQDSLRNID